MIKLNRKTGLPYLPEDVSMRLGQSVVMYDGDPVYIDSVLQDEPDDPPRLYVCRLRPISKQLPNTICPSECIELPDPRLDINPVKLGYVNITTRDKVRATYTSRSPVRKYKQGLNNQNIHFAEVHMLEPFDQPILQSVALGDCILGKYPTYEEALKKVQHGCVVAFHRRWAISMDEVGVTNLQYRGQRVGVAVENEFSLGRHYHFLKEELERIAA